MKKTNKLITIIPTMCMAIVSIAAISNGIDGELLGFTLVLNVFCCIGSLIAMCNID